MLVRVSVKVLLVSVWTSEDDDNVLLVNVWVAKDDDNGTEKLMVFVMSPLFFIVLVLFITLFIFIVVKQNRSLSEGFGNPCVTQCMDRYNECLRDREYPDENMAVCDSERDECMKTCIYIPTNPWRESELE